MSDTRLSGLPLLSGPVPAANDSTRGSGACRKCAKEFNVLTNLFNRPKQCNHCGYLYCSTCTDYQALMPRAPPETSGYDTKPVCAFCIEYLNITAAGRVQLKNLPVSKLKQYTKAYNIKVNRAVEKDDFIDAIISARTTTGCLSRQAERYYRTYSVPDRSSGLGSRSSFFHRSGPNTTQQQQSQPTRPTPSPRQNTFARPDLDPNRSRSVPPQRPASQSPRPTTTTTHTPPRPAQPRYPNASQARSSPNVHVPPAATASSSPPRTGSTSTSPPPTLDELITMSSESINALSISTLKAILFANHVNARQILEKAELVTKVNALVEEEKQTRERHRIAEEMEREYIRMRELERLEELEQERRRAEEASNPAPAQESPTTEDAIADEAPSTTAESPKPATPPAPSTTPPKAPAPAFAERSGLCVICQDEEASIVIVDCGHLCLCRECSGVVMQSTRECPLCRTRIITEQRLLRVFRT